MRTVRIGVVGAGVLGRVHAKLYKGIAGAELVGVYDANPETARAVAAEFGTTAFLSTAELAAAVDGLSVAVPTDRHHDVVLPLLAGGTHVLVEKPIAHSSDSARAMVEVAAGRGLILAVGHVERFNPVVECLDRTPGEPRFIEAHRLAPYPPPRPGLKPRGTEVSVVLDLMIHDLDVILHLVRAPVQRVDAVGVPILSGSEDIANARVVFANGCVANITASRVSQERLRKIRVFKTQAYLSLDYQERKGETVYLKGSQLVRESVPIEDANALERELQDFCACIREVLETGRAPAPRVSGEQGLQALALAEWILRSAAENRAGVPPGPVPVRPPG
jgi:predicted dehydrogenase